MPDLDNLVIRYLLPYQRRWLRDHRPVVVAEQCIDDEEGIRALVLRFEKGGRVVAGSSNPKFFRSKGGDTDADEFAFHAQPRELYKAMQPAALMWGHQLRLWSTHNGEGSYFNKLIRAGKKQEEAGPGHEAGGDEATVTGQ